MTDAPKAPFRIEAPGFYPGVAEADYHADPCPEPSLSKSIAWIMLNSSPAHARLAHPRLNPAHEDEEREQFDIGNACHALLFGEPADFSVIQAENYKTKAAREARDAAYAEGKTPLLQVQWERVQAMVKAARIQLPKGVFEGGQSEILFAWCEGPVWCRGRLDYERHSDGNWYDYKTTGGRAEPAAFERTFYNMGYHVQAAFYERGLRALLGGEPELWFRVQEQAEPYAFGPPMRAGPLARAYADDLVERAIRLWHWCIEHNRWPGYAQDPIEFELPVWLAQRAEAQKINEHIAASEGRRLIDSAIELHRP